MKILRWIKHSLEWHFSALRDQIKNNRKKFKRPQVKITKFFII